MRYMHIDKKKKKNSMTLTTPIGVMKVQISSKSKTFFICVKEHIKTFKIKIDEKSYALE